VVGENVRCIKGKSLSDVEEEEFMRVLEDLWAFLQVFNLGMMKESTIGIIRL